MRKIFFELAFSLIAVAFTLELTYVSLIPLSLACSLFLLNLVRLIGGMLADDPP